MHDRGSPKLSQLLHFGIRQKVILVLLTVLLSALSISAWLVLQQEKTAIIAEINQRSGDISRFVAKSLTYSVVGYDYHSIDLLLDEITSTQDIAYARVLSKKGNVMAESGNHGKSANSSMIFVTEKIVLNGETIGELYLGMNTTTSTNRLESQTWSLLGREAVIIILIAIAEFLALSYLIIRPVRIISMSLKKGMDKNGILIHELPELSDDEFGDLARQFNTLGMQLTEANYKLKSKIDLANNDLKEKNIQLNEQSEELRLLNDELKQLSVTDPLTGLYNRRHFEDLMKTEFAMSIRHGDSNSLIMLDIDYFKLINDTYGHNAGDIILKNLALELVSEMRATDILCRIGGEEFIAFCKRAHKEEAFLIAEKLRKKIAATDHILIEKHSNKPITVNITVSIGIATFPDEMETSSAEVYFRHADLALYHSKDNGRNRVTHYNDCIHPETSGDTRTDNIFKFLEKKP